MFAVALLIQRRQAHRWCLHRFCSGHDVHVLGSPAEALALHLPYVFDGELPKPSTTLMLLPTLLDAGIVFELGREARERRGRAGAGA